MAGMFPFLSLERQCSRLSAENDPSTHILRRRIICQWYYRALPKIDSYSLAETYFFGKLSTTLMRTLILSHLYHIYRNWILK